jgi:hypothetical protein
MWFRNLSEGEDPRDFFYYSGGRLEGNKPRRVSSAYRYSSLAGFFLRSLEKHHGF